VSVLINFINDLLDFQKLDEGKVQLERTHCSISSIIKESISLVRELASVKEIEIIYSPQDFEVYCDQVKISQTVLNLLSNGIKFSPAVSSISVDLKVFEKPAQQISEENVSSIEVLTYVRVSVSDLGPGVPSELRQKIFEPFEQASSHRNQGTGLGLAICKMIVEAHGGSIGVSENTAGSGSTFWFEIPTSDFS